VKFAWQHVLSLFDPLDPVKTGYLCKALPRGSEFDPAGALEAEHLARF
jgi:hypothetical protein